jgi:hypothetical protein
MADPKLGQIDQHGEDCYQPVAVAKADQAKARAALTTASERLVQVEATGRIGARSAASI